MPYENLQLVEKKLFEWEYWDQFDTMCMVFYSCTLIKDIGKYKKGDHIDCIDMDYKNGKMLFWNNLEDDKPEYAFNIELVVHES